MTKFVVTGVTLFTALAGAAFAADLINGAGATFPAPIYQKWFGEFKTAHPDVQINYQYIGSGAGIRQLTDGNGRFRRIGYGDERHQIGAMKVKPLHFPTVLGAVVLTYNIPELTAPLNLTSDLIAGIFLGEIKKWNDPKIVAAIRPRNCLRRTL